MSICVVLPDVALQQDTSFGRLLRERGLQTFRAAAEHVHQLPYGRPSRPDAVSLVLSEGRGTCSSKHALLAELAREHDVDVQLMLALFEMNEANTPGVGAVLHPFGFSAVPEAHCFLRLQDTTLDITHPDSTGACELDLLIEAEITPAQIGAWKVEWHRKHMAHWCSEHRLELATVWEAREACIRALACRAAA